MPRKVGNRNLEVRQRCARGIPAAWPASSGMPAGEEWGPRAGRPVDKRPPPFGESGGAAPSLAPRVARRPKVVRRTIRGTQGVSKVQENQHIMLLARCLL